MGENLNTMIKRGPLSDNDISSLVGIIGSHCSVKTKDRIRSILKYSVSRIGMHGIYDRLNVELINGYRVWSYCAGQSYLNEIRTIRSLILDGI